MSGYQVAQTIRKQWPKNMLAIVAVTANAMPGEQSRTQEAGCNGLIPKPINIDTFASQVTAFVVDRDDPSEHL